jgi:hypothetical protein
MNPEAETVKALRAAVETRDPAACGNCGAAGPEIELQPSEVDGEVLCLSCVDEKPPLVGGYAKSLQSIQPEKVDWLWPGRIPFGMLSLLIGDPGLGKSLLSVDIAAKVSRAGGNVLLASAEDHAAITIRPRAEAAGADLNLIHTAAMRRGDEIEGGMSFPEDCEELAALIQRHSARLVVIDPLMAHMGSGLNTWSDHSTRQATAPLHRIAEDHHCAILVVHHLNKGKGADPMHRAGGSIGIPAAVRSAMVLARDPEDPEGDRGAQRVLAHFKCNIGPLADSLTCEIVTAQVRDDLPEVPRLKVIGTSQTSGADLLGAPTGEERTERSEAVEILASELDDTTPRRVQEVKAAVLAAGVSPRTLDRAKRALGVLSEKKGFGADGEWYWRLPKGRHGEEGEERQPYISPVASLGGNGYVEPNGGGRLPKGRHGEEMARFDGGEVD